jgi:AcrR family transcriptional regulator
MEDGRRRPGGRRAEAARNDERVLRAARDVLCTTPDAPLALVARRAQVGIGSLYRRHPSRDALVARTCLQGVLELEATARVALDRARRFPRAAFVGFLTGALADGSALLIAGLAGTFSPDRELLAASERLEGAVRELVESVQAAGALRPDVTAEDLVLLFQQLRAIRHDDAQRELALRRRCLQLMLQALHAGGAAALPGPAPDWKDLRASMARARAARSSADT